MAFIVYTVEFATSVKKLWHISDYNAWIYCRHSISYGFPM